MPLTAAIQDPPYGQKPQTYYRQMARKIGGTGDASLDNLQNCLERLRQNVFSDRVAFYYNVSARLDDGQLLLTGTVDRPEYRDITREVFQLLGHTSVVDRVQVLPDPATNPEPFGLAMAPHVLTWSNPDLTGIPMDEALLGEPVYLLQELPTAYLIKTHTGYWGFAKKEEIRRVTRPEFIRWLNDTKVAVLKDYQFHGQRIPNGSRLLLKEWGKGKTCRALNPAGGEIELPKTICQRRQREEDIKLVLETARTFLNAPYQLGGKNSVTGIDCSGVIQLSYRAIGLSLPRDAKQQYLGGYLIMPCLKEALLPGDALYFINDMGQVYHTGIYLGNEQMLHATPPFVKIQSINPTVTNSFKSFEQDFLGAKRFWW